MAVLTPAISTFPCIYPASCRVSSDGVSIAPAAVLSYTATVFADSGGIGQSRIGIPFFEEVGGVCMQRYGNCGARRSSTSADGGRLGYVGDVDLRMPDGQVAAIDRVRSLPVFSGCSAGERSTTSRGSSIQRIGDDIILIDKPAQRRDPALERRRRKKF